jgi:hypothetical protein
MADHCTTEFAVVLQLDREMESAIAGVEFNVPAAPAGIQAARCCWVGSASGFIPTCHPGTVGNTIWGVDLLQPLFRQPFLSSG